MCTMEIDTSPNGVECHKFKMDPKCFGNYRVSFIIKSTCGEFYLKCSSHHQI